MTATMTRDERNTAFATSRTRENYYVGVVERLMLWAVSVEVVQFKACEHGMRCEETHGFEQLFRAEGVIVEFELDDDADTLILGVRNGTRIEHITIREASRLWEWPNKGGFRYENGVTWIDIIPKSVFRMAW